MASVLDHPQFDQVANSLELDRGLPLGSLRAVAMQESGGRADARSGKAYGLMQFTPATAKAYNVDVTNPWDSLRGAADYLSDLQNQHGSFNAALAGYNGGTSQAKLVAAGQQPTFDETKNYVQQVNQRMGSNAPSDVQVVGAIESNIAALKTHGYSDTYVVQQLLKSPVANVVQGAKQSGFSDADIVQRMGGQPLQAVQAAQQKVDGQGFLTNLSQGASNAVGDMVDGAKQLGARLSGNDAQLKQLQSQAAANDADPTRQALSNTAGGMIGNAGVKAVPYLVAGAVAPEGVLPMIAAQAGVGAADGALTPTTGDGQILGNIGTGAALGAAGGGTGELIGKGVGAIAGKTLGAAGDASDRLALMQAAQAQGLPVTASNIAPFWRQVADSMPHNSSVEAAHAAADQALTAKIAEGLGVNGWKGGVSTDLLAQAEPGIKSALDNATNVQVTLPASLKADLQPLIQGSSNPLLDGIATNSTVKQAAQNLLKASEAGTSVAGSQLQALNAELKALVQSQGASATEKQMAGQLVGKVNGTLTGAMTPEQQAAYAVANGQYANLKAVENMVRASNDSGSVTPRQVVQAVKSGRFKSAFLDGEAPYQDLGKTAAELYGPANGKGLGDVIGKAVGGHGMDMAALLVHPHPATIAGLGLKSLASNLLAKAATSSNPAVVRMLTGTSGASMTPATQAYIARLLGSVGAATAS